METIEGKIKEFKADTAGEFWDLLCPEQLLFPDPCKLLYRGQASASWKLEPALLRPGNNPATLFGEDAVTSDRQIVAEFVFLEKFVEHCDSAGLKLPNDSADFRAKYLNRNNASGFDRFVINGSLWPPEVLFELMALAQHHGLPTRLLDWSRRSYIAAYFAAADALKVKDNSGTCEGDKRFSVWLLNIEQIGLFRELTVVRVPGSNSANIAAQAGAFTLLRQQGGRGRPFEGTMMIDEYFLNQPVCPLIKVTAPMAEAPAVISLCAKYGITGASVYPDYYGAAQAAMDDLRCWSKSRRV